MQRVLMLPGRALPDFSLGSCSPVRLDSSIERPLGEGRERAGDIKLVCFFQYYGGKGRLGVGIVCQLLAYQ
jgi:hypothetical protein